MEMLIKKEIKEEPEQQFSIGNDNIDIKTEPEDNSYEDYETVHFTSENCDTKFAVKLENTEEEKDVQSSSTGLDREKIIREGNKVSRKKYKRRKWRIFPCFICTKEFSSPVSRNNHMRSHFTSATNLNLLSRGMCTKNMNFFRHVRLYSILSKKIKSHSNNNLKGKPNEEIQPDHSLVDITSGKKDSAKGGVECKICSKRFPWKSNLNIHMTIHNGVKPYKCNICFKSFARKSHLNSHLYTHNEIKTIKCNVCCVQFKLESLLAEHMLTHERKRIYKCEICGKDFSKPYNLKQHSIKQHSIENPFKCNICFVRFSLQTHLIRHNIENHVDEILKKNPNRDNKNMENLQTCQICLKEFPGKSFLIVHMRIHTGEKPFKCKICERSFSTTRELSHHSITHKENSFNCNNCSKAFKNESRLIIHQRTHTGEKPFKCEICLMQFARKPKLSLHLKTHDANKWLKCDFCSKSFIEQHMLNKHLIRSHTSQKPYKCEYCSEDFEDINLLNIHKIIHDGETIKCDLCPKRFLTKQHLKSHMRYHRDKKHVCLHCSKKFRQNFNLVRHMKVHSGGEKSYKCEICLQEFTRQSSWKLHTKSHPEKKTL